MSDDRCAICGAAIICTAGQWRHFQDRRGGWPHEAQPAPSLFDQAEVDPLAALRANLAALRQAQAEAQADDPHTHARTDDPWTSHEAAQRTRYAAKWRVLSAYLSGRALIDHEACELAGMSAHQRQRCSDLRHLGYIEVIEGRWGLTPDGRRAQLCRITQAGREAYAQLVGR